MYTLTRKLSVVCLTVVLSFLVYGCGGSSKQALITDVSTDMVTAGLTPDSGTYTIQPGGTANAGDVTFTCPTEGPPCEVTVAEDGTVTSAPGSAPGMATAMDSASAAAMLVAVQAQAEAETARDTANAAAMLAATAQTDAETERDDANAAAMLAATAQTDAETARDDANAAAMLAATAQTDAETERDDANAAAMLAATAQTDAETARDDANAAAMLAATAQTDAETERDDANAAAMLAATAQTDAETARDDANAAAMLAATAQTDAETARDDANAAAMLAATAQTDAETARDDANAAAMLAATAQTDAETDRDDANAAAMLAATAQTDAETARDDANAAAMLAATAQTDAETERDDANAAAMLAATAQTDAETERDDANAAAMLAATAQTDAETERDDANAAAMLAATAQTDAETERDDANAAAMLAATAQTDAETERDDANAAAMLAATAQTDAETERDDANAAAMLAATAQTDAETERDDALAAQMVAEKDKDVALEALRLANLRADPNSVDLDELEDGYMTMTPDTYNIEPGENLDVDDANFACPAGGLACEITVADDGTVTSAGGMATAQNSMAANTTKMAKALTDTGGALLAEAGAMDAPNFVDMEDAVERGPNGVTIITLTHDGPQDEYSEYTSNAVDRGHGITGWKGLTLKRNNAEAATDTDDAVPASILNEATFYTNIKTATAAKLTYKINGFPAETDSLDYLVFTVDPDQEDLDEEFTGSFIRPTDGSRIPGTFTCSIVECTAPVLADMPNPQGNLLLPDDFFNTAGWTFESDVNEKEGEKGDDDYLYFGYWLKSPVGPSSDGTKYQFTADSGGKAVFTVLDVLIGNTTAALKATYEGGAAGRYVSRELRIEGSGVDPFSPGTQGRFTAKAELTAYFTNHASFEEEGKKKVMDKRSSEP